MYRNIFGFAEWVIYKIEIHFDKPFIFGSYIYIFSRCNDATINLLYYNFIWLFQVQKLQNKWQVVVNLVWSQIFCFFIYSSKFRIGFARKYKIFMVVFSCVGAKVSYLLFKFDLNIEISEEFECDAKRFICWENLHRFWEIFSEFLKSWFKNLNRLPMSSRANRYVNLSKNRFLSLHIFIRMVPYRKKPNYHIIEVNSR